MMVTSTPAPASPNPTRRKVRTALHHQGIDNICEALSREYLHPQTENEGASGSNITLDYDPEEFPEALSGPEPMDTELTHTRLTDYSLLRAPKVTQLTCTLLNACTPFYPHSICEHAQTQCSYPCFTQ